jgi:hypothetical protein
MDSEKFPYTIITADGTFRGRLTEEDVVEVAPEYINIEPNYEMTAKFLGESIIGGFHERPALALYSFTEQIRYLTQRDLPAVQRIIDHFKRLDDEFSQEDQHLEADYEDRNGYPDLD